MSQQDKELYPPSRQKLKEWMEEQEITERSLAPGFQSGEQYDGGDMLEAVDDVLCAVRDQLDEEANVKAIITRPREAILLFDLDPGETKAEFAVEGTPGAVKIRYGGADELSLLKIEEVQVLDRIEVFALAHRVLKAKVFEFLCWYVKHYSVGIGD